MIKIICQKYRLINNHFLKNVVIVNFNSYENTCKILIVSMSDITEMNGIFKKLNISKYVTFY